MAETGTSDSQKQLSSKQGCEKLFHQKTISMTNDFTPAYGGSGTPNPNLSRQNLGLANKVSSAIHAMPLLNPQDSNLPPTPSKQERNIDKVMLGNLCFDTHYLSYYRNDMLGDKSSKSKGGKAASHDLTLPNMRVASPADTDPRKYGTRGAKDDEAKASGRARDALARLERLYVCPCCFKYSKELMAWCIHMRLCIENQKVPGEKVYIHPRGMSKIPIQSSQTPSKRGGMGRKILEVEYEEVVTNGEYSIWEVDGDENTLFCQNLSLFAKLFLETKSVCYDVQSFKYYILVYTAPPRVKDPSGVDIKHRILGFFSKEKMSWDCNNLACILIFPPWQGKGLGSLLMGVSYEISRRERIMGGPEKPLSEMGLIAYKRFWGSEIARYLLIQELSTENDRDSLLDIEQISKATWILPEDCVAVLRDIEIEGVGVGTGKPKKRSIPESKDSDGSVQDTGASQLQEKEELKFVKRVRLDKNKLRRWIAQHKISLSRPCDPSGFVHGFIQPSVEDDDSIGSDF